MKEFNKALSNFINDAASGGAVRHLADLGYSISDIAAKIDFPLSKENITKIMWDHFINTGKISLTEPAQTHEKVSFVKEQDAYGRISFRKVVEHIDTSDKKYVKCDFGKKLYQNTNEFNKWIDSLRDDDREYIRLMPWPLEDVYHELDERMIRIGYKENE